MPKIKTDYLKPSDIQRYVAEVQAYYSNRYGTQLPFNAERLLETEYSMKIVPLPGLRRLGFECSLTRDGETILVDKDDYETPSKNNRLNFTFAHELAHKVLHEKYLPHIDELTDEQFRWLERQADMFASDFLMPEHLVLGVLATMIVERMEAIVEQHITVEACARYQVPALAACFAVSTDAMGYRLNHIDLTKVVDTPYISEEQVLLLHEAASRVETVDGKVWRATPLALYAVFRK